MRILKVCRETVGLVTEWLGKSRTPRRRGRTTRPPTARPRLEELEGRVVPANTWTVNVPTDAAAGA